VNSLEVECLIILYMNFPLILVAEEMSANLASPFSIASPLLCGRRSDGGFAAWEREVGYLTDD